MRILSIGDVHGRDSWKFLTHESSYDFDVWKIACDNGASPLDSIWKDLPYMSFDKIIFVGDYVDSYHLSNVIIKSNLLDIIYFKKMLPDKVVLLLGNHDIQYLDFKLICTGYRSSMKYDLFEIFNREYELFDIAYEIKDSTGINWIWTHAGVTSGWYQFFKESLKNLNKKHLQIFVDEHDPDSKTVSENLNFAWKMNIESLFTVDNYSGGCSKWAGPFWVRPYIFNEFPLTNHNQIVGHTPQAEVWKVENEIYSSVHYFIDLGDDNCGLELNIH